MTVAGTEGAAFTERRQIRAVQSLVAPGAAALATCALLAVWTFQLRPIALPDHVAFTPSPSLRAALSERPSLYGTLAEPGLDAGPPPPALARLSAPSPALAAPVDEAKAALAAAPTGRLAVRNTFGDLRGANFAIGPSRLDARASPLLQLRLEAAATPEPPEVASIPLPPRRPTDLAEAPAKPSPTPTRSANAEPQGPAAPEHTIFEKIFGAPKSDSTVVAYANTESPFPRNPFIDSTKMALSHYDKFTAVYDIQARAVYLPSGKKLEAHSGYGDLIDDPKHVDVHARGATPPATYELAPRESLFHGVQALRMKPTDSGTQFGREGLLVHPYMLGPGGDSNGCVSIEDYEAFLAAYQNGEVKRLVVVAKLQ